MRPSDLGAQLVELDKYGLRPDQKIHAIELLLSGHEITAKAAVIRILKWESSLTCETFTFRRDRS